MSGPRVLVVEDEAEIRDTLRRYLEAQGYKVREAEDGTSALRDFDAFKPDVVLLDLMLPDIDGVTVCQEIRRNQTTPVIVVSARGDEKTKILALDQGADDYLTKPFSMNELLARIRVALRHGSSVRLGQPVIRAGTMALDLERRFVTVEGEEVHLSPTEYSLLRYFALNAGKVLTHSMILRAVWGEAYSSDVTVLRTFVNQLRAKLESHADAPKLIRTEPRIGYRFGGPEDVP